MEQLKTRWTDKVDKEHVLEEYPRPMMVRTGYINLNGIWRYAITETKDNPREFDGEILVPFSPEALLSGVGRQLKPKEYLWYERELPQAVIPEPGIRTLLHFGAVDQSAVVVVNGQVVKKHRGGYLPFSVDITEALDTGREGGNRLLVLVRDCSETSYYSRGKQKLKRGGMFYTAQSGIWQTVWAEKVPDTYISELQITPIYEEEKLRIKVCSESISGPVPVTINISSVEMETVCVEGVANVSQDISLSKMHPWSPEDPFLYDVEAILQKDCVKSYAAMRKISVEQDGNGISRMFLNGKSYFQKGLLDQGYWPDGLYTAPTDEAMIYDIQMAKSLGFNLLRKHMKIEPQRWYYHCDRLGMLVWQDMVNGGREYKSWYVTYLATAMGQLRIRPKDRNLRLLGRQDIKGRAQFIEEMRETIRHLYNHPSIVTWVIFNEGWGQFHAGKVTEVAREADSTRLIDQASGWFDQGGGDIKSIHEYFFSLKVQPEERVTALTEFGGYSMGIDGHRTDKKVYGYRIYRDKEGLTKGYRELIEKVVLPNIPRGLSATIYTQLSDIEEEVNGVMTYDREVLKIDAEVVRKLNEL